MKKLIFVAFLCLSFALSAAAQSGIGGLKGIVVDGVRNPKLISGAKVELRSIENHSGTDVLKTATTGTDGSYGFWVSFGYYLLTISAPGHQTYQTKVFIPSSTELDWSTLLEKEAAKESQK